MSRAYQQLDLFDHMAAIYASMPDGKVKNESLYRATARMAGIPDDELDVKTGIGKSQQLHNLIKRKIRWHQQTMKHLGLLERAERGMWQLTKEGKQKLRRIETNVAVLGYSTDLGICIWGAAERVFDRLDRPITLCLTSLPYKLRKPRAYGNVQDEREYIDFCLRILEPVVRHLARGASLCLNLSNDLFEPGSPARSMYIERLLLSLHDNFGLSLLDRFVWLNPNKPPGPIQWASKERCQLSVGYEPIYWLSNSPECIRTDNRRVLQEHTEAHLKLIRQGGEKRNYTCCDGAYTIRAGKSFANETPGKIPRNVLKFSHNCANKREIARAARAAGLPVHGATMPLALARFLVDFMTGDGDDELVADPCSGWNRTGLAAEMAGVPWIASEIMGEYVQGGAAGFTGFNGFKMGNIA